MESLIATSLLGNLTAAATTFGLIFLAEIGDKSQLVCMALAARHRHRPVFLGALAAFVVLNGLAVVFGAGLAQWVPERVLAALVAILFAVFGLLSLRVEEQDETEELKTFSGHGLFVTTFLMIFLAEMGDKTQLAVAGMTGTLPAVPVWIGATLALGTTSALGVFVGCRLLRHIPLHRLHQISGLLFLMFAAFAVTRVF
ncbi:TMEM165/GDT1 family protein [Allochromatium humboldtianum]|uniref:GDT1 family protein n=1 Tax=Allochromatium humboldtianum TaxID=504901 RepID=A0A850RIJ2_9GAMM|nr:TMEM165/GDT1 family protein [Allochromatium humboldtianum]NVZ10730.1 TMEM165/GDT1 family protein [Allochromatium humboldtianum]